MYYNKEHERKVNNRGDGYIYIGSYKCDEKTIDGKYSKSSSYIRIKCPNCNEEYDILLSSFVSKKCKCPYCTGKRVHKKDSFGQWLIDTYGEDAIEKYWSPKNTLDPFKLSKHNTREIWMLCQDKNYHNDYGGYKTTTEKFSRGYRCIYCSKRKIHYKDSFGYLYQEKAEYWSSNNDKSPYEVAPKTGKKFKFICEKCGKEFKIDLHHLNRCNNGIVCRECKSSELEQSTKEVLDKYNIKYKREYSYENLTGLGGNNLRFDFYLPDYNALIECQGIQHKEWQEGWQTKEDFLMVQEHDKRKKEYCKQHNIKLLEIWYYDYKNIENIVLKELIKDNKYTQ